MKRIPFVILLISIAFVITNCNKDDDETSHDTQAANIHLFVENALLDIYKQVQTIVKDTAYHLLPTEKGITQIQTECATIEFFSSDTLEYDSLRIKYGQNGCSGINDYTRAGTIIAQFDGKYGVEGSKIYIIPSGYSLNGNSISKTINVECSGSNIDYVVADSLRVAFDGLTIYSDVDYSLNWISGLGTDFPDIGDDSYEITGTSQIRYSETDFSAKTVVPLAYRLNCKCAYKGVTELNIPNSSKITIDYGTSGCDNNATCTIDGKDYSITID